MNNITIFVHALLCSSVCVRLCTHESEPKVRTYGVRMCLPELVDIPVDETIAGEHSPPGRSILALALRRNKNRICYGWPFAARFPVKWQINAGNVKILPSPFLPVPSLSLPLLGGAFVTLCFSSFLTFI